MALMREALDQHSCRLRTLLVFVFAAGVWDQVSAVVCDVGDAVSAQFTGDNSFRGATIARMDLSVMVPEATVNWDGGSLFYRVVPITSVQKSGIVCNATAYSQQVFSAVQSVSTTLLVDGSGLQQTARMLIVGVDKTCGSLSAIADPAVSSRPGTPVGMNKLFFFGVVVDVVGSFKVCFWSGQSVDGNNGDDVVSYATFLGLLVVTDATTTTTTTTTAGVVYSRRRGTSHTTASLRVEGSHGFVLEGLTANPAAWNVHVTGYQQSKGCRRCGAASLVKLEGSENVPWVPRQLRGGLVLDWVWNGTNRTGNSSLGFGCSVSTGIDPLPFGVTMLMMVARGQCPFDTKLGVAASRGFAGLLIVDFQAYNITLPDMAGRSEQDAVMPAWVLPSDEGDAIRTLAQQDPSVTVHVADELAKPRLGVAQSDDYGLRKYSYG